MLRVRQCLLHNGIARLQYARIVCRIGLRPHHTMRLLPDSTTLQHSSFPSVPAFKPPAETSIWIGNLSRSSSWGIFGSKGLDAQMVEELRVFLSDCSLTEKSVVTRLKEGGLFATFNSPTDATQATKLLTSRCFRGRRVDAFVVEGSPFIEDMFTLQPSPSLKISFSPGFASSKSLESSHFCQETLFTVFRKFGKLTSLEVDSANRTASVLFSTRQSAIAARNCCHHMKSDLGLMTISYGAYQRFPFFSGVLRGLMSSRVFIPLTVIGLSGSALFLVDPVRLINVTRNLSVKSSGNDSSANQIQRTDSLQLSKHFNCLPKNITLVVGEKGSGKSTIIRQVTDKRLFTTNIDCKQTNFGQIRGESELFVEKLGSAFGFRPSFSTLTRIIGYFENLLMVKNSQLTNSRESQLRSVLDTINRALLIISQTYPRDRKKTFPYALIVFDHFHELLHSLDGVACPEKERALVLLNMVLEWAAHLAKQNMAHVVFVSDDPIAANRLNNYEGFRSRLHVVHVSDLSPCDVERYLTSSMHDLHSCQTPTQDAYVTKRKWSWPGISKLLSSDLVASVKRDHESVSCDDDSLSSSTVDHGASLNVDTESSTNRTQTTPSFMSSLFSWVKGAKQDTPNSTIPETQIIIPNADVDAKDIITTLGGHIGDITSLLRRASTQHISLREALNQMVSESHADMQHSGFGYRLFRPETAHGKWSQSQVWKLLKLVVDRSAHDHRISHDAVRYDSVLYSIFGGDETALKALVSANIFTVKPCVQCGSSHIEAPSRLVLNVWNDLTHNAIFSRKMDVMVLREKIDKYKVEVDSIEEELALLQKGVLLFADDGVSTRRATLDRKLKILSGKMQKYEQMLEPLTAND